MANKSVSSSLLLFCFLVLVFGCCVVNAKFGQVWLFYKTNACASSGLWYLQLRPNTTSSNWYCTDSTRGTCHDEWYYYGKEWCVEDMTNNSVVNSLASYWGSTNYIARYYWTDYTCKELYALDSYVESSCELITDQGAGGYYNYAKFSCSWAGLYTYTDSSCTSNQGLIGSVNCTTYNYSHPTYTIKCASDPEVNTKNAKPTYFPPCQGPQRFCANGYCTGVPLVNSVTSVSTAGGSINITGLFVYPCTVHIYDLILSNITNTSKYQITAIVPPGTGARYKLNITCSQPFLTSIPNFQYLTPQISTTNSPSTAGGLFEISGANFGQPGSNISLVLEKMPCYNVTLVSDNFVTCIIPSGVGYFNLTLTSPANTSHSQVVTFKSHYASPHISAVNFPSNAGGLLNINGSNFGQAGTNISVLLGGIPCDNVTLVSDSYVTCVAPIGVGYFTVTLATPSDALHAQVASFKSHYVTPIIENINFAVNASLVKGTNFGVGGSYLAALQMGDAKIECEWMSIETMVCDIPLQPGAFIPFSVWIGDANSNTIGLTIPMRLQDDVHWQIFTQKYSEL